MTGAQEQGCGVCGTPVSAPAPDSATPRIITCPECGTGITVPAPTRDVTGDDLFVEVYGDRRMAMREQWFREARSRLEWIGQRQPAGSMLEIGCATGEFVAAAADAGYRAFGCDTSGWAVERAAELGRGEVTAGTLSDWRGAHPDMRVDAAAAFHVIEHLREPGALLEEARSVLTPGGMLFLEVPNYGSAAARRDGAAWAAAMLDDHFHHFTPGSISRLLDDRGFEVLQAEPIDWRPYDPRAAWLARRLLALRRGMLRPSQDLLRARARRR
jgi:SAM-dependent methyltransferase